MTDSPPPTVVNPDSIGDPNQTPVVCIGDAGEVLGIPERAAAERRHLDALAGALRRLTRDAAALGRGWIQITPADATALLAALSEAQRERDGEPSYQLLIAGWSSVADLHKAYEDVLERWQQSEPEAWADIERMRPVVEALAAWIDHQDAVDLRAVIDAYRTYKRTQESTNGD